ncbi:MAG TPA: hypothetical protein VEK08_26795 [Planctomycetota bacterium]|nr:hypothetical protein [Planctomycetota bacterium]
MKWNLIASQEHTRHIDTENEAVFSRGLDALYEQRCKLRQHLGDFKEYFGNQYQEDIERYGKEHADAISNERAMEAEQRYWFGDAPLWMQLSGLYRGSHTIMSANERAGRLRKLLRRVERLIRAELRRATAEISPRKDAETQRKNEGAKADGNSTPDSTHAEPACIIDEEPSALERTHLWDPIRAVCTYLEIPQRVLSSLLKEISGMSIEQLVDRIKAETIRGIFKARLKVFLSAWFASDNGKKALRARGRRDAGGPSNDGRRDAGGPSDDRASLADVCGAETFPARAAF